MDKYLPGTEDNFFCDTLEPTWCDYANGAYKVKGRSAIPEGRYAVVNSFSPKFQQWLPILLGGQEFNKQWQGIRIHAGNTAKDTQGRILVGKNREVGKVLDIRTRQRASSAWQPSRTSRQVASKSPVYQGSATLPVRLV